MEQEIKVRYDITGIPSGDNEVGTIDVTAEEFERLNIKPTEKHDASSFYKHLFKQYGIEIPKEVLSQIPKDVLSHFEIDITVKFKPTEIKALPIEKYICPNCNSDLNFVYENKTKGERCSNCGFEHWANDFQ